MFSHSSKPLHILVLHSLRHISFSCENLLGTPAHAWAEIETFLFGAHIAVCSTQYLSEHFNLDVCNCLFPCITLLLDCEDKVLSCSSWYPRALQGI